MYTVLISVAAAVAVGVVWSLLVGGWFWAVVFGFLTFAVIWLIVGRRLRRLLEPALRQAQKQAEAGMVQPALETLRGLLPMGRWIPLLSGQIYAQMGVLAHHSGDKEKALEYLGRSTRRSAEAQILRACIYFRDGDFDTATKVLDAAGRFNKKSALLHNVYAYLLNKQGRSDDAIAKLNKFLAKDKISEASRDNLLRLQNGRKMNMKPFGLEWYALGLERPPARMGEMRTGRKGFRQPPKKRGKR